MTSREFIQAQFGNADGKEKWCSSIYKDGKGQIYSYGLHYPLLFVVANQTFRNVRGYSVTTSKHISWCYGFNAIDVELDREASQVISSSYEKEENKLAHIVRCLKEQRDNLQQQIDSKKRTNTWVYSDLTRRVNQVQSSINLLDTGLEPTDGRDSNLDHLHTVGAVMALGDIFSDDQKGANDWKARMLKAGLEGRGLIMPDDWDQLTEDEKEARLNGAIQQLS